MTTPYKFQIVTQNREDDSYHIAHVIAFSIRDLKARALQAIPFGYRFKRIVKGHAGSYTELYPLDYFGRVGNPST